MSAIDLAAELVRIFEGFKSKPYKCPAGIWTIGFGTTRYPDGRKVKPTDSSVDKSTAEIYLEDELEHSLSAVIRYCPKLVRSDNRLAAIADFTYNLGIGALQTSTLRKRLNQQDWMGAKKELRKWVHGGGRVLPGLVKRREIESKLL
jgi:lysozyme